MSDLIDRDYMLSQIEKAKAEKCTFDYDSLIDFIKVLPKEETGRFKIMGGAIVLIGIILILIILIIDDWRNN